MKTLSYAIVHNCFLNTPTILCMKVKYGKLSHCKLPRSFFALAPAESDYFCLLKRKAEIRAKNWNWT